MYVCNKFAKYAHIYMYIYTLVVFDGEVRVHSLMCDQFSCAVHALTKLLCDKHCIINVWFLISSQMLELLTQAHSWWLLLVLC